MQGGAVVTGILWLESPWVLDGDDDVQALGDAIGSPSRRPATLRSQAWEEIAARFADPFPVGDEAPDPSTDVLAALAGRGVRELRDRRRRWPRARAVPGAARVDRARRRHERRCAGRRRRHARGDRDQRRWGCGSWSATCTCRTRPTAAAAGPTSPSCAGASLSEVVSTVDDVDLIQGPVTVALALAGLQQIPPVVGHYGYGPATVRLPDPLAA